MTLLWKGAAREREAEPGDVPEGCPVQKAKEKRVSWSVLCHGEAQGRLKVVDRFRKWEAMGKFSWDEFSGEGRREPSWCWRKWQVKGGNSTFKLFFPSVSASGVIFSSDWAICFSLCRVPPSQVQNCQQTEFFKIKKKSSLVVWNQKRGIRIMGWRISWNYRTTQWPLPTLFRDHFSSVQIVQDPQAREWTLANLMFLITS